jgi:hypothetical protein
MKRIKRILVAVVLSTALLVSSCIGSFKLTNAVYDWNQGVGDKFVNELVFLACLIVPIYEVALVADGLVLNSIEFWSGNNPMTMKEGSSKQKLVEIDGKTYRLTSEKYRMKIEDLESSKTSELVFRAEDNSWYMKKGNKYQKLIEAEVENGEVVSYHLTYPDGSTTTVNRNFDRVQIQNQILSGQNLAFQQ